MGTTKKKPPFATIYTVSSVDHTTDDPVSFDVIGSCVSRGAAIRRCANYILERMEQRPDIRYAVRTDQNHQGLRDALNVMFTKEWVERILVYGHNEFSWEKDALHEDLRQFLFDYFVDEIGGESCYIMYCPLYGTFRFDVTENDVEGVQDAWSCITTGDMQPYSEVFLSEKEAVKCAIGALKVHLEWDAVEPRFKREILKEARARFRRYGKYCYTPSDGPARRWSIWYTPIALSGKLPQTASTKRKRGESK